MVRARCGTEAITEGSCDGSWMADMGQANQDLLMSLWDWEPFNAKRGTVLLRNTGSGAEVRT